ncbi:MAG: NAD-dependent epimerase/dehydratase family protein [Planctomycetota bacterium]
MNVLLIGGSGNISTEVARALAERNHEVMVLSRGNRPVDPKYTHIRASRDDAGAMAAAIRDSGKEPDVVINFLGFGVEDCKIDHEVFAGKIRQYIFISTAMVYSKPHKLPITEDHPRGNELSDYATAKIACEDWLLEQNGDDFPVTIVRPSHTFGQDWIPSPCSGSNDWTVAARILAGKPVVVPDDGQSLWTLTACSDFADALVGLVGCDEAIGEAFHITHDAALSWNAIYFEIGLALGKQAEVVAIPTDFLVQQEPTLEGGLKADKAHHAVFDNTKIKRFVPDWEAKLSFRQAIRKSMDWYRQGESRQNPDAEKDAAMEAWIEAWQQRKDKGDLSIG